MPATGPVEVVIGVCLLTGMARRLTLALFFALLLSTFSLLITNPEIAFEGGNPLKLTTPGEFICKNVVLIAAAVALVAARYWAMPRRGGRPGGCGVWLYVHDGWWTKPHWAAPWEWTASATARAFGFMVRRE